MGIRFYCPNQHKLNVKDFQAGRTGICPFCGVKVHIPLKSTRPSSKQQDHPKGVNEDATESTLADAEPSSPTLSTAALSNALPVSSTPVNATPSFFATSDTNTTPSVSIPATAAPASTTAVNAASTATTKVDPLAEAGTAVWYVRPPSGGQFGPAPADVMRGWIAEGRVSADTFVWREGWRDWLEAGEVFPQLSPSPLETIPGLETELAEVNVVPLHPQPKNTQERTRLPQIAIIFTTLLIAAVTVAVLYLVYTSYGT